MSANSFDTFKELIVSGKREPSRSNLYGVQILLPPCLYENEPELRASRDVMLANNYLADTVTVPGKTLTEVTHDNSFGQSFKLASGQQSNNDLSIEFVMDKRLFHRQFFEKWMNYAAPDSERRVTLYDEYTTNIMITKWELGSPVNWQGITDSGRQYTQRLNSVTGVWQYFAAWPKDMAQLTFNNGPTNLVKFQVRFNYERYRFDTVGADELGPNTPDRYINSASGTIGTVGLTSAQEDAARFGV
tara:strand:+ start:3331 stop:4065 length:735 start_codon:yes stop_codon:yes gene_type:complete